MKSRQLIALATMAVASASLAACGSDSPSAATKTVTVAPPGTTSGSIPATNPSSSGMTGMEGHSPIPANTEPMTSGEIFEKYRKGTFYIYGRNDYGTYSAGTGFIHDIDLGIGITNAHVVMGQTGLKGVINGEEIPLHVLGVDPCTDVAVVGFTEPLPDTAERLPVGDSDALVAGTDVTAIGYPGTLETTAVHKRSAAIVTTGSINDTSATAAVDPSWPAYKDAILHDATLNPGNSGGPLFDDKGNVIGINSYGSSESRQYYSIPINAAHEEADTLKEGKSANNVGWTLVSVSETNPNSLTLQEIYDQYGLAGGATAGAQHDAELKRAHVAGMFVSDVEPGSSAEEGKILSGYLITRINGTPVDTAQQVCDIVEGQMTGVMTVDGVDALPEHFGQEFHARMNITGDMSMHEGG